MMFYTIKELMEACYEWNVQVVDVWQENKWAVAHLNNGFRVKIKNW
ncbi:MAG: hypothetical protein AAB456_00565 [Patescibacteria group bacterium]